MTNKAKDENPIYRHRRACYGFCSVVEQVGDGWDAVTPCHGWDARDLLEHVIGFHEVLLLRPLGVKANRPKDDIPARWLATQLATFAALDANWDHPVDLPGDSILDVATLLPALTNDVLVHTWDLGKAIGIEPVLDEELCERALSGALANEATLRSTGMYARAIDVPASADTQSRLLGYLGRDPGWKQH